LEEERGRGGEGEKRKRREGERKEGEYYNFRSNYIIEVSVFCDFGFS